MPASPLPNPPSGKSSGKSTRRDGSPWWQRFALLASVASVIGVHAPLIAYKTFANVDEAYATALAARLLEGHKLYQGAVSQRGPLMYYLFEAFAWLHGWDNIVALRVWALCLALVHLGLVYFLGTKLFSKTTGVVATTIASYALSFGFPPEDALAINGEPLQLPFFVLAVYLGWCAVKAQPGSRQRFTRLAIAGLLFGVAVSIKQSVLLHPAPVGLLLALDAHRRREPLLRVVKDLAVLGATTLFVPALFALHAQLTGTLQDFYYYTVVYNRDVHLKPTTRRFEWLPPFFFRLTGQTSFFIVTTLLFARTLPYVRRRLSAALRGGRHGWVWTLFRGHGAEHYVAWHLALAVVASSAMYRFFPHYYVQALPFLAVAMAKALLTPFRRRRTAWGARTMAVAFAAFVVFAATFGTIFGEKVDGRVSHDRTFQDAAKYIEATTNRDDRLFVWGFSPWLYPYSHRRPAGRFVFSTYVTGFVPWYWEKLNVESARIVPGSVEALLADLDREKPAIVVDAGSVMMARPMRMFEKPTAWLYRHYCFEVRFGALDLYRRKVDSADCAYPHFPRPAGVVDWMGRGMGIPLPMTLDFDASARLPIANFLKPNWFTRGPKPPGLAAVRDAKRDKEEAEGAAEGFYVFDLEQETEPVPPEKRYEPRQR